MENKKMDLGLSKLGTKEKVGLTLAGLVLVGFVTYKRNQAKVRVAIDNMKEKVESRKEQQ